MTGESTPPAVPMAPAPVADPHAQALQDEIAKLRAENQQLKAENRNLKQQPAPTPDAPKAPVAPPAGHDPHLGQPHAAAAVAGNAYGHNVAPQPGQPVSGYGHPAIIHQSPVQVGHPAPGSPYGTPQQVPLHPAYSAPMAGGAYGSPQMGSPVPGYNASPQQQGVPHNAGHHPGWWGTVQGFAQSMHGRNAQRWH